MEAAVRLNKIRNQLKRDPFRPFRIGMSDGTEHIVSNPKFVLVSLDTVHIGVPEDAEDVPEYVKLYDKSRITRVEPICEGPGS